MFCHLFWIVTGCFCFVSLWSHEESFTPPEEPFISSLVKTQNLLSTVVDSVSAISGEWMHSETDFVILGPEPLILNRYYTGDHAHSTKLGYNWDFSRPHRLIVDVQEKKIGHTKALARLHHPSGIATIHASTANAEKLEKAILPLPLSRTQGLTNCRGEMSAKTNLHNTIIQLDFTGKHCAAVSGSGHLTYYQFSHRQNLNEWRQGRIGTGYYKGHVLDHYLPVYERKPNGNTLHFGKGIISAANSSNTQVYGTLQFRNEGMETLIVEASDGKRGIYHFTLYDHLISGASKIQVFKKHRFYLTEASFSHKPTETYEYTHSPPKTHTDDPENPLLKAKRKPNGRFQAVEYYHKGTNQLEMEGKQIQLIQLDHSDDFRMHRVKVIKAPVGCDRKAVVTHRFIYETDEEKTAKKGDSFSGRTKVYDAYFRKTVYEYNQEHRPLKVKRYDGKKKLYSEECYTWDDRYAYPADLTKAKEKHHKINTQSTISPQFITSLCQSIDSSFGRTLASAKKLQIEDLIKACFKSPILQTGGTGNLLGKYVKDDTGHILYAQFFEYDDKGNIIQDRFYGDLRGQRPQRIELNAHQKPKKNGCEYYEKRFTYSNDKFNLLKTEEEDNGKGILYDYYPETDLVAAKYVTENGTIRLRQFFHYDSTATLIKIVKDDGDKKGEDNFSGVSERHMTYLHPRKVAPLGLPESIEHKVFDLQNQTERQLKKVCFHYSQEGYLLQQDHFDANDQWCYSLYWSYDAHGNVTREVNALGHAIIKEYDENDNLIRERGPRPGDCKEYTYDFADRLISTKTEADGKTWVTYNKYDLACNRIAEIDRYGNERQYEYDDFNRLVRILYPAIVGQADRPSTQTIYDCLDRPIQERDERGFVTTKTYNARGKVTSILYPDGQLERFEYHLDGALAKKVASNGTATHLAVDCFGRVLAEKVYSAKGEFLYEIRNTYNSFHKTSSTDATGLITYFDYDSAGRLIKATCLDKVEMYEYDALGRLTKKKEPFHLTQMKVSCTEYDVLDRIIEERIENEKGQILKKVSYQYDLLGQRTHVIEETHAGISQHLTFYNFDKKPIKIIDPEGHETHITYEAVRNELEQWVLQTKTTDPLGRQTIITYDAMERPVSIKKQDPNGVRLAHQDLLYDAQGHLIRLMDHLIIHGEEIRSIETAFAYQEMGELSCWIQADKLPEQQITRINYNRYGQKESLIKNDGTTLFYTYDPLGRLKTYTSSDHSIDYAYHYNLRHQILAVEDHMHHHRSQFEYDPRGRLLIETLSTGLSLTYEYDVLDRVINLILPEGSHIAYTYDAMHLKEVRRYKNQQHLYTHCYDTFDLAGLLLKATTIHQQEQASLYDLQKRPIAIETCLFKQNQAQYDPLGYLQSYAVQDSIGSMQVRLAYDDLGHLISEEGHRKHLYCCDSLHNRISKNHVAHTLNGLHQLIHDGEWTFTYDQSGNLKSKQKGSEMTSYTYDALDRLIAVKIGDNTVRYLYDAFNRRVAKITHNQTIRYLYVGQDEMGAVDEAGGIQELRILGHGHGAEIGASIAIELQDKIFAPSHDFQGNIVSLSDSSGVIETYRYTTFGETALYNSKGEEMTHSLIGNPWRFASKRFDEESGFIYFGRRYYDPTHGRWITADPIGLADGPNLYAYLHHHPLQAFDLYGLQEEEPYYPLRDVDYGDNKPEPSKNEEQNANLEVPLGFIEKKRGKKDRMFFCGFHQIAEIGISCINGIMNTLKDAHATARALSEMAGDHYVNFVYNQTRGFIVDLVRSFFELYFYIQTQAVKNQQAAWDAFFAVASPDAFLYHECHSEGAIITRNALMTYPEELRKRIIVVAIAPGAYIEKKYAYQVTHYKSTRDIVPLFDFVGAYRCRDSTVVLKPHPDAPWFDHSIASPTYQSSRKYQIDSYIEQFGGMACAQAA
jgi:RHS repeat-associated protein